MMLTTLLNCILQFGDNEEVIYLAAETENEQRKWIQALRKGEVNLPVQCRLITLVPSFPTAADDCHNEMIARYHPAPYTGGKWSCCKAQNQHCQGCQDINHGV